MIQQRVPLLTGLHNLFTALRRGLSAPGLWMLPVLLALLIYAGTGYARGLHSVTLIVDGESRQIRTRRATVGELLADLDLQIRERDRVAPDRDAPIDQKTTIVVQCARPVTVVADGVTRTLYTHSQSIDDILQEANLALGPQDRVYANGELILDTPPDAHLAPASLRTTSNRGRQRSLLPVVSQIKVERATSLQIHDNGIKQALYTTADTVGQALLQAGVPLYLADQVHPDLNASVSDGIHVHIQRGKSIQVQTDGQLMRTRTQAKTVEQVLTESGVTLVGLDFVTPPAQAHVSDGMQIKITRVTEATIIEQELIPFETVWLPDASLELDQKRVDHVGENGVKRTKYKALYYNGQQVETHLEDQWVAKEPHPRQIVYGTKIVIRTLETEEGTFEYWRRLRVFLTSYTEATCGKTPDHPWYGKTRIGWQMRHGIIAVDPRVIPMLTEMYVTGYGPGIAADTGGLIKGMHIDLGHEVDDFVMYYWWGYAYLFTPVPPANQIRWILPDFPRER